MPHPNRSLAPLAVLGMGAALVLSGCSIGGKPPPFLLTRTPVATPEAGTARAASEANRLTILEPTAPAALRTARIPVLADRTSVAYVKDAAWTDYPARLFQQLLSETVRARTTRLVLDADQSLTAPGETLSGELLAFGIDASRGQAVVTYVATRVGRGGVAVTQRRFEAREPVGTVEARTAGAALSNAANRVAVEVADWIAQPAS